MRAFITGLLAALFLVGCAAIANAHPHDLLVCGRAANAALLTEEVLPNGLYAERYDSNADGKVDIVALSAITATTIHQGKEDSTVEVSHANHPTFYLVDRDLDDFPDVVLIDKGEGGKCTDIVLYHDLNKPQTPNAPAELRGGAL